MRLARILAALVLGLLGCGNEVTATRASPVAFTWPEGATSKALLHVRGMGTIEIELYPQIAPNTVDRFVQLAREGFYDATTFHRVIPNFMIQAGDPNTKDRDPTNDGRGGAGLRLDDEFNAAPHEPGSVSMANFGRPNSADSQFFIVQGPARHLDGKHTVFGEVVGGKSTLDRLEELGSSSGRTSEKLFIQKASIRVE